MSPAKKGKASERFSAEERDALKERAHELKAGKGSGEGVVLAKIAELPEPDRALAERLHAIIRDSAPDLTPRTWYGMPPTPGATRSSASSRARRSSRRDTQRSASATRRTSTTVTCGRLRSH